MIHNHKSKHEETLQEITAADKIQDINLTSIFIDVLTFATMHVHTYANSLHI